MQVRVDAAAKPVEAVYAQHSGAERCGWPAVRTRDGAPVAFLANGSHAAYFRPGARDRTFPDPNDEAGGHGRIQRPRLVVINARDPGWMRFSGRWGDSRARLPLESSSPRGPAFQGERWDDPSAFAASARDCMAGRCDARGECDNAELALAGAAGGILGLLGLPGGNLFGRLVLHPSVTEISDQEERGKVVNAVWKRDGTVNSLSLLAVVSGWAGARAAEARAEVALVGVNAALNQESFRRPPARRRLLRR